MPRILIQVADEHLTLACAAALAAVGHVQMGGNTQAGMGSGDLDVCVADATFAGAAIDSHEGFDIVITRATGRSVSSPDDGGASSGSARMRLPFSVEELRQAVRLVAGVR